MRVSRVLFAAAAFGLALAACPAGALTIVFSYPAGMSQQAIDGFNAAAARLSANFTDPVTVNLSVDFTNLGAGVLGSTTTNRSGVFYYDLYNRLSNDISSPDDTTAVSHLQPNGNNIGNSNFSFLINHTSTAGGAVYLDNNGTLNNRRVLASNVNLRALGFSNNTGTDATIKFSSAFTFDFNPADGITSGSYDFVGLATHEMMHALGFSSGVDTLDSSPNLSESSYTSVSTLDLFRYSAMSVSNGPGVFDWTADTRDKYFSIDGGTTAIASFSTGVSFGDGFQASHWKHVNQPATALGIMDPAASTGQLLLLSDNDRRAMDVIGYNRNFTWKWSGPAAGNWQTSMNWNAVGVPSSSITANFDGNGQNPTVTLVAAGSADNLTIAGDAVTINLGGNSLNVSGTISQTVNSSVQVGTMAGKSGGLTINGPGTLMAGTIYVGGTHESAGGTGAVNIGTGVNVIATSQVRVYPGASNTVTVAGTLTSPNIVNEGYFTLNPGGTLNVSGSFVNSGTAILGAGQHWGAGSILSNQAGTLILNSDAGSVGQVGPVLSVSGGSVILNSGQHLNGLALIGGSVVVTASDPLIVHGLDLSGNGTLNLGLAQLIDFYQGASPFAQITASLALGRIDEGLSALPFPTTLAPIDNSQLHLSAWFDQPLFGVSGDFKQILLAATYVGDVNLDGQVTDSDYVSILSHMNQAGSWLDGDVNHDGLITIADFKLVAENIGAGTGGGNGPALLTASAPFSGENVVGLIPEPGMAAAVGLMMFACTRRRRVR